MGRTIRTTLLFAGALAFGGCGDDVTPMMNVTVDMAMPPAVDMAQPPAPQPDLATIDVNTALRQKVQNIVVIFAENRSFDSIYGAFPGANGIPGLNPTAIGTLAPQLDRDAANTQLAKLPQTWGGVTASGQTPVVTQAMSDNLPNMPYEIDSTYSGVDFHIITRDLYHRFFENQMQINGGKNDQFAAWADSGGLVMGHYDGSKMALWNIAKQYVLADNFYMGAFGGSFLNHQYLICGCAPEYPNADTAAAAPTIAVLDRDGNGNFLPHLTANAASPASAITGAPTFALSGNLTPKNYFRDNTFRAVNTMQPPYQPSGNAPAASDTDKLYADPAKATTLPAQTQETIGDVLDGASVTWKWYSGAWNSTTATATTDRNFPPSTVPGSAPNFQFHHQPFNYYSKFDPTSGAAARTAHLKDYNDLVSDAQAGTLPQVTFYKPEGDLNQHAGYASVAVGDQHIADVIAKLQASPQWQHMIIIVTYDENGGWWDHAAPPKGDQLGPGTRIPALVIAPFAKMGTVDHTQYDTGSIQRLINRRFGLTPLPGIDVRDHALQASGGVPMGDFTNAIDLQ